MFDIIFGYGVEKWWKSALVQMKQAGEPIVLTVNSKAEVVVQDAKSYQQLLEKIERLEAITSIKLNKD
ncbi:MAG: hypothetical protein AAGF26_15645 [Cyanobacteria bacterium P01_G01_bin.49]